MASAAAALPEPQPEDRWRRFVAEAEGWRAAPPLHHSEPPEAAMTLLHSIRADARERALLEAYNKRLSIEATYAEELADARAEAKAERERAESERAERERAEAAVEALRAKLRALGIDPVAAV
jgi:hypothetical protein